MNTSLTRQLFLAPTAAQATVVQASAGRKEMGHSQKLNSPEISIMPKYHNINCYFCIAEKLK